MTLFDPPRMRPGLARLISMKFAYFKSVVNFTICDDFRFFLDPPPVTPDLAKIFGLISNQKIRNYKNPETQNPGGNMPKLGTGRVWLVREGLARLAKSGQILANWPKTRGQKRDMP